MSLPPKLSERVVRRVVIVFEYRVIRVNTEFRVKRFPRFLYRSHFTEHSPLLSHNIHRVLDTKILQQLLPILTDFDNFRANLTRNELYISQYQNVSLILCLTCVGTLPSKIRKQRFFTSTEIVA